MEKFKAELEQELFHILSFWQNETWDKINGGFIGAIDGYNRKYPEASKGVILNARILWAFSAACNVLKSDEFAPTANRAYDYIIRHFLDKNDGGMFWELDFKGKVLNSKKQVYAQAFAIYALAEYHKFSKIEEAKKLAIELFRLLEKHAFDQQDDGYLEAFNRKWKLLEDLRLSDKDANEKKTMNTHLHVLEAYTNLLKIWPDDLLRKQLKNLVRIHIDKILDKSTYHLNLFFDEKWNLKSDEYSFGHDIEAAWLLCEAAKVVKEGQLINEVNNVAVKVAEVTLREGLDIDGGLMQEGKGGNYTDTDKHWWPQAEAIVGFLNAFQLSKKQEFLEAANNVWQFTKRKIIDPKNGEWWWRVNRAGTPYLEEEKAGFWKCPYHNSRVCLEVMERL